MPKVCLFHCKGIHVLSPVYIKESAEVTSVNSIPKLHLQRGFTRFGCPL